MRPSIERVGERRRTPRQGREQLMWWLLGLIAAASTAAGLFTTRLIEDPLVGIMASEMVALILLAALNAAGVRYDA